MLNKLLTKIKQRVAAYPIGIELDALLRDSPYLVLSEDLLEFTIVNRLRIIIILEGAVGTEYEALPKALTLELTKNTIEVLNLTKTSKDNDVVFAIVEEIYENFLMTLSMFQSLNR